MAAILQVGSLDLSKYLDVQQGEGLDPAGSDYLNLEFSHSVIREGGTLAVSDAKIKQLPFPLWLKSNTKDGLAALIQQINIALVPGAVATWQDDGASVPTYYDLAGGQLDLDYDFRKAQQKWIKGHLRLFVQPFGRLSATTRIVATAAGSESIVSLTIPSTIAGDVPALAAATIVGTPTAPYMPALSVLPDPAYKAVFRPGSLYSLSASVAVNSASAYQAAGATTFQWQSAASVADVAFLAFNIPTPALYTGRNRVFMVAKCTQGSISARLEPFTAALASQYGSVPSAAYGVQSASAAFSVNPGYYTIDLGVISMPTSITAANASPQIIVSLRTANSAYAVINEMVVLPEKTTVLITGSAPLSGTIPAWSFMDGTTNTPQMMGYQAMHQSVGLIPRIPPATSSTVLALMLPVGAPGNVPISAAISVQERTRYAF